MAFTFDPPAGIDDFNRVSDVELRRQLRENWHDFINLRIANRDANLFYNPAADPGPQPTPEPIPWNGFPNSIWQWFKAESDPDGEELAYMAAETLEPFFWFVQNDALERTRWLPGTPPMRQVVNGQLGAPVQLFQRQQDEYCEWHVDREGERITRISFTAEGPEYWEELGRLAPALVGELYREFVNPQIQDEELFWQTDIAVPVFDSDGNLLQYAQVQPEWGIPGLRGRGSYNAYNVWNTLRGAMHLTHGANTLGAEMNLAADATVLRPSVSPLPSETLAQRLICCAGYGGVNRESDPKIGAGVNGLARQGFAVTLANPVGLYIGTVGIEGLRDPDGRPIPEALRIRRPSTDTQMKLRVEVAPPDGATYTLEQCKFFGDDLRFGGQIARSITMLLFGWGKQIQDRTAVSTGCEKKCCNHPSNVNFKAPVAPQRICENLRPEFWANQGPLLPETTPEGASPAFAAAAATARATRDIGETVEVMGDQAVSLETAAIYEAPPPHRGTH
jgi:hypothetical protein